MKVSFKKNKSLITVQNKSFELLTVLHEICSKHNIQYWIDFGTLLGAYRHKDFIPWDDDIDVCLPMEDFIKLMPILSEYTKKKNNHILFFTETDFDYWYEYFGNTAYLTNGTIPVKMDLFPVKIIANTPEAIAEDRSLTNIASIYILGKAKNVAEILDKHYNFIPEPNDNIPKKKKKFFEYYFKHMAKHTVKNCLGKDFLVTSSINDALVEGERDYFKLDSLFPLQTIEFKRKKFPAPNNMESYLEILYGNDFMQLPPEEKRVSHIATLKKNKIPKNQVKELIYKIYQSNMTTQSFEDISIRKTNKLGKIKCFFYISLSLLINMHLKTLYNYIIFFILFHLPVTNKVHLEN